MKSVMGRGWLLSPVLPLLLLLLLLGGVYALTGLLRASTRVEQTDQVELSLVRLERSLFEAQGGVRGYLASGESRFLDTYQVGRSQTWTELDRTA